MTHPPIDQQVTFLYTRDLEATARFYEGLIGLPLALDQGSCRIYRVAGRAYVGFCQREEAPERPQGVILTLVTGEVDRRYETLRAKGVTFEKTPSLSFVLFFTKIEGTHARRCAGGAAEPTMTEEVQREHHNRFRRPYLYAHRRKVVR